MKTTKRLLALLLSVLMLLGVLAVAAAAEDELAGYDCPECGQPLLEKNLVADHSCKEGLKKNYYIYYCANCDDGVYVYLEEPAAHTWEEIPGKAASYKETGTESGRECTVCGKVEGCGEIGLQDHKMGDDGYCTVCGKDLLTDRCPYCHQQHGSDFGGKMTRFFHNIANFFQNMFNR